MFSSIRNGAIAAVVLGGLTACSSPQLPTVKSNYPVLQYTCDQQSFQVTQLSGEQILLLIDGTEYHLHRVPSASGIKYTLDGQSQAESEVELFSKGRESLLTIAGDTDDTCLMTTRSIPNNQ
ncbi:MliC family protein [Vibrio hangzhouensis]|uniref:MliC family protein n=1 Tax=Vibrio hangzhouensis TaxID=462991 RepID=UPI001C98A769|nr:MliC family protein [Vibrio hangzhouensis]MBY6197552.1 MliC family protein [Vibrio hangzhouensis]